MYIDTHAHYDSHKFDSDRDAVLSAMPASGVDIIIDPGCDGPSSRAAIELAERYSFVYAAVGWQPQEWESWDMYSLGLVRELAAHPKCVAIGEIGLDYYWDREHKELMYEMLVSQLELALELDKPVIIHDREAHADTLAAVKRYPGLRGVFHCYSGSREMAEELLALGWYLGFDGPVTYKNSRRAAEVLSVTPPERILLETDSIKEEDGVKGVYVINKLGDAVFTPVSILSSYQGQTVVEKNYFYDSEGEYVETVENYDEILKG